MPTFGSALKLLKIPAVGLVPEKSGVAPTTPVTGQMWTDTSVAPNVLRFWDGTIWTPWIYIGTAAGSAPDATLVLLRANNLSDLASAVTARGNLGLGTAAVTNTGTGAANTILGNDTRLSDQRTPTDASVTGGTAGAGVKLAALTITAANIANGTITDVQVAAANKDGTAGTPSLRTLGTAATQAMIGSTTLSSIAAPTANVAMAGFKLTGLGAPTANTDAARLVDVQGAAAGIDAQPSVRVASTANVVVATGVVNGAVIDGVALVTGDRVLLKAQTTASENGVYITAAAGAAARAVDNISANTFWFVEEGTAAADTQYVVTTNNPITLGTTGLVITQFGAATNYVGTAGRITITGNAVDIAATYVGQASITTLGTITTGVWTGTAIAVANGGTGATTAPAARTALGAGQRGFALTLGAVTAGTPLVVTHNLNDQDVFANVRDASTNEYIGFDIINASANTVTVTSGVAYAANALRISVFSIL